MARTDRRTTLAGIAGMGSCLALEGAAGATAPRATVRTTPLGHWSDDRHGLPCYVFTADVPVKTVTPAGRSYPLDPDPVFLVGNYDLTLFASASGRMQFISGERGWVRLNEPTAATPGNAATLTLTRGGKTRTLDLLGPEGACASGHRTTRTFGCGTARYRTAAEAGLTVERILSVAPSTAETRAQPAVVVTVRLTNTGPTALDLDYVETVLSHPTVERGTCGARRRRPIHPLQGAGPQFPEDWLPRHEQTPAGGPC